MHLCLYSEAQITNNLNTHSVSTNTFADSNLPIVNINTNGQSIINNPKIIVEMRIINNGPGLRNHINDTPNEYNGNIGIEFRGSHSQTYPKKSYSFETMDNSGTVKTDVSIFGMPLEHDWILTASYVDKSLCRDVLTYQLSREMGHYAVRTNYVEVVINGQYQGIYILSESIKRDIGRVDIANLHPNEVTPPDITGGYIFKLDKITGSGGSGWTSSYPPMENSNGQTVYFMYDYPTSDSIVPAQEAYLQAYVDSFEDALAGPNFRDTINGYSHFIGKGSWIDYFFISELSKNIDAYRISAFLYKDKNKTIKAGPVWDYDIAWGNANICDANDTTGWAYQFPCFGDGFQVPFWWQRLLQDTNYTNELKCRWTNYRQNVLSEQHIYFVIDSVAALLNESQERNFTEWPLLGTYIWPNPSPQPTTYAGEIQNLKNWVHTRLQWLDANFPGRCACFLSASIQNTSCNTSCDGSAIALGSSPYQKTYFWNNGSDSDTLSNLCAGNYSVTFQDAIGCRKTKSVIIAEPNPITLNISTTNSTCAGNGCNGSAIVNALGGSPSYSYTWSNGQSGTSPTFLCKGTYTVTVNDNRGCTKSFPVSIQNPLAPTITVASISNVQCYGGSDGAASVNVSGGTGPYSYNWFPSGGNSSTATGLSSGDYTVTVFDTTGCSSKVQINIPQPTQLVFHSTLQNAICNGSSGSVSVNITGGTFPFIYSWFPGGNNTPVLNSVPSGLYTLTVTDNAGCSKTSSFTISQPQPFSFVKSTALPDCFGGNNGSATVNSSGGTGTLTYFWPALGKTGKTVNQLSAGSYTVIVTDASNCTGSAIVTVINPSLMTLLTSTTPATCNFNDGTAEANVMNGNKPYQFNWFPSVSTDSIAIGLNTGSQIVTVIDSKGCLAKDTVTIVSASGLNVSVSGQTQESCYGVNDAFANLNVSGGAPPYSYVWTPTGGFNSFASNLFPGNYIITISDINNCVTEYQLNIIEPAPVSVQIISIPAICNNTSTGSLNANVSGGTPPFSYLWNPGGATAQSFNNLSSGNYSLHISDVHGCVLNSSSTVSQPAPITISVNKKNSSCGKANGSIAVRASGGVRGYSYLWSNGDTDSLAENLAAGNYSVTARDFNGCSKTANFNLGGIAGLTVSASVLSTVTCNGGNNGSVLLSANGGSGLITYSWTPNISSGALANNLTSGMYSVIVTDANNCRDSIGFILPEPPPLAALIFSENIKCYGTDNGLLYADAGGGTPPYTYLWSDGQREDSAIHLSSGTFSLLITDSRNCTTSASGTILSPDSLNISFSIANATCSSCLNGNINATVNGGTLPYSFNWKPLNSSSQNISNLAAGLYTLCVTDGNNCSRCDSVTIDGGGTGIKDITRNSGLYVYPNPLNQYAVFAFVLKSKQVVDLRIFSASGQLVNALVSNELEAGEHLIRFNASDFSPGIYFYKFTIESYFQAGALVISR